VESSCMRRILVLLNPAAGNRRSAVAAVRGVAAHRSMRVELVVPDASDRARQLDEARAAVDEGVDAVLVHGGDGALSGAINLVAGRPVPLGIVPAGTGNDFARAAGIDRSRPRAVLDGLLTALEDDSPEVVEADALVATVRRPGHEDRQHWVANSVNIGFDAKVNQRANGLRTTPRSLRYLVALAQEVPQFEGIAFGHSVDGSARQEQRLALICVQNGPFIGGGIALAPHARIDDGRMSVSFVEAIAKPGLVALFPLLMLRRHKWLKPLSTREAESISIDVPAGVPVFADGDELAAATDSGCSVEIEVRPRAFRLLQAQSS
ncbi:diacylglycerol/lipid kinase family protein, partial [Agrococcus casei]|uniref:diacylglycerol/lipid kinase family protein n=2 Tax=Agrococcus casei TaxID=343512 RepID=UPI003F8E7317